jgi:predicted outer membrane repeat protein
MISISTGVLLQVGRVISLLLASLLLMLFYSSPAYAGGVVGNGTAGSCTEAAFDAARVGGGNITFNCGGAKTITLTFYKEIDANTTIDGGGLITLSSNNTYLFQVFFGRTLTLQNITLANSGSNVTGAIENFGTTTIINSQLTNNHSTNNGGAILNSGTLNLTNTILSNNKATNDGGGIYNNSGNITIINSQFLGNVISGTLGVGGAIANQSGSLTVQNSTFNNNRSLNGAAIYVNTGTSALITATLISSNTATGNGGGIYTLGTLSLTNMTLSGNRANSNGGGGIYQDAGNTTLNFVTVASNTASVFGGGVYNDGSGTMTLRNTLLANNTVGNCDGVVGSAGHNLSSDTNCASFTQTGDQQSVTLPLGALANNGGPTLTHLPLPGNPAIDGGVCVGGVSTDQRGWGRPYDSTCDVGAVEVRPSVYLPVVVKS